MLYLSKDFELDGLTADPFQWLQNVEGKIYRQVKGRKTLQFFFNNRSYFVKLHMGVGWLEIAKNLSQFRLPILGAGNEWRAITKLEQLGIATMKTAAYGQRGWNPATRQSFIVTEELTNTTSLEDYCRNWSVATPGFAEKKRLIEEIARISRILHSNGICHRDYYLCHFLLHPNATLEKLIPKLSLIDLHRALIKRKLAIRWAVKDIAGLYYSAMGIGLTRRDLFRFIKNYYQADLRQSYLQEQDFWNAVQERARRMYSNLGPAN